MGGRSGGGVGLNLFLIHSWHLNPIALYVSARLFATNDGQSLQKPQQVNVLGTNPADHSEVDVGS